MSAFLPVEEQLSLLLRGVAQTETISELRKKLERSFKESKPLRIKYGIDPTGFDVHLGHTVPLRKLKQFQELGHTAVLIIGTATAAVGDPSGRDAARQGLTPEQIEDNAKTYLTQIAKVVDVTKAEVRPNGDWFSKFGFREMLSLMSKITVQRMTERDDFTKRIKGGTPIYLHECLYPLMQGHDSVEIRSDVELGGTEQLFNLMVGRNLQRDAEQEPQICMTMPILIGTEGAKKMGKTAGNYIGLNESATEMFGKTMSIPDELMRDWFVLLTNRSTEEINEILAGKPNEAKKMLGSDIVRFYHGEEASASVLADWLKREKREDPDHIDPVSLPAGEVIDGGVPVLKLIVHVGFAKSNSEARKKVEEGAFNYGPDKTKPADWKSVVPISNGLVLRLGRKIVRVVLS